MTISPNSGIGGAGLNSGSGIGGSGLSGSASTAPVFDPDTIFTASRAGDFFEPSGWYQDNAQATPADEDGDVVQQWVGSRSAGTGGTFNQGVVGSRPAVTTDATHGLVLNFIGSAAKSMSAGLSLNTAILNNGGTIVARTLVASETNVNSRGHALIASSSSVPERGLCIVSRTGDPTDTVYFGGDTSSPGEAVETLVSPYLGSWMTIVAKITSQGDGCVTTLYINDSDTPVGTVDISVAGLNLLTSLALGHASPYTSQVKHYKGAIIDEIDTAVSDWFSWLEA